MNTTVLAVLCVCALGVASVGVLRNPAALWVFGLLAPVCCLALLSPTARRARRGGLRGAGRGGRGAASPPRSRLSSARFLTRCGGGPGWPTEAAAPLPQEPIMETEDLDRLFTEYVRLLDAEGTDSRTAEELLARHAGDASLQRLARLARLLRLRQVRIGATEGQRDEGGELADYVRLLDEEGPDSVKAAALLRQHEGDEGFQRLARFARLARARGAGPDRAELLLGEYLDAVNGEGVGSTQAVALAAAHPDDAEFQSLARLVRFLRHRIDDARPQDPAALPPEPEPELEPESRHDGEPVYHGASKR